jgi:hypothetical protein
MYFREGQLDRSVEHLCFAANSLSQEFPVECLNAHMVLAHIFAHLGQDNNLADILAQALAFHSRIADDFEVKINFRLQSWFEKAVESRNNGKSEKIRAYLFSH